MLLSKKYYWIIAVLVISASSSTLTRAQENTLAIFSFRPTNFEAMSDSGEILLSIISAIEKSRSIDLMSRREMEETLTQNGIPQTDNTSMVLRAGRALGVDFILFGQVTRNGGKILYICNLMDIQNEQVTRSWSESFTGRGDIVARMPAFVSELTDAMTTSDKVLRQVAKKKPEPRMAIDNLKAEMVDGKVELSWKYDPSLPIRGFNIYRSKEERGPYEYIGRTVTGSYQDGTAERGQVRFYRIGILAASGPETKSDTRVSIRKSDRPKLHPPIIMNGRASIRRVEFGFIQSALGGRESFTIKKYIVYRKADRGGDWTKIATIPAQRESVASLQFEAIDKDGLEDGKAYTYAVSSLGKDGEESQRSDPISLKTIQAPTLRSERSNQSRKIRLVWNAVKDVKGYNLYRRVGHDDWIRVGQVVGSSTPKYVDTDGLSDGQQYQYYMTAYDTYDETGASNEVTVRTKGAPPFPEHILVKSGMLRSAMIMWAPINDPDIDGYNVYRGSEHSKLEIIAKVKGFESESYIDKGSKNKPLKDGTDYLYSISSVNTFNTEGKLSPTALVRTKPRPGRVKGLSAISEGSSIHLKWESNPQPDVKRYVIYRSRNAGEWLRLEELGAKQLAYRDEDLKPEDAYGYRIVAEDTDGLKSEFAETRPVTSEVETILVIEKDDMLRQIDLSWQALKNVDGYFIYRRSGMEDWKKIHRITNGDTTRYTDEEKLLDGTRYLYYLTSFDAEGETGPSNEVSAKTKDLPPFPRELKVESSLVKAVAVSWNSINDPGIGGYSVYRGSKSGRLEIIAKVNGFESESYMDKGTRREPLEDGTDYLYSISSFNTFNAEGERSPTALAKTKPRPGSVKGLSAIFEGNSIHVRWEKNPEPDIKHYVIYRSRNAGKWMRLKELDPKQSAYRDEDLRPEDAYGYRIIAEDMDGLESELTEADPVQSETKTILAIEKDDILRQIDLSWKPLKNISGYHIYRKSGKENWKRIRRITNETATRYTDKKGLLDGKQYQYYLTSFDSEGETGPSNEVSAKTKDLPSFPGEVKVKSGLVKAVEVSWDPINDPDIGGYHVYRGSEQSELESIAKVRGHKSESYIDEGTFFRSLEDGKTYYYSVASYNLFGSEGELCPAIKASTKPRPIAVRGLSVSADKDRIIIEWNENPEGDIKDYVLYRRRGKGSWSRAATRTGDQTTFTDSDLKPGETYSYRVIVEDTAGLKSDPSDSDSIPSPLIDEKK